MPNDSFNATPSNDTPALIVQWQYFPEYRAVFVNIYGEINEGTWGDLRLALDRASAAPEDYDDAPLLVVLNLQGVPYIDRVGLGSLIMLREHYQRRFPPRQVCLLSPRAGVALALRLTGMDTLFTIYTTTEDVLGAG